MSRGTLVRPGVASHPLSTRGAIPEPLLVQDTRTSSTNPTPVLTTVAASATAHTKGAWVELFSSTTGDADLLCIQLSYTVSANGQASAVMFDVGVGAASSEVIIVNNVASGAFGLDPLLDNNSGRRIVLPVRIPRGSRVAVRLQSERTSPSNFQFCAQLLAWPKQFGIATPRTLDTIGATTASTSGVSLGATSNTGVQVTASAPSTYQGFVVCFFNKTSVMNGASGTRVDIGVGAAGSERWVESGQTFREEGVEQIRAGIWGLEPVLHPIHCPVGSRIAARGRGNQQGTNAPQVVLLGVPYA